MNRIESTTSLAFRGLYNSPLNVRAVGSDNVISGLAVPYGVWTRIQTEKGETFMERIQRGALKETLAAGHNITCLVNHEARALLGDTQSNLKLFDREDGLHFELSANNDRAMRMIDGVRTGFFDKCSFLFKKSDWNDEQLGGMTWRTIKVMELYEISLVDSPAYKSTTASAGDIGPMRTTRGVEGVRYAVGRR
ncbi:HK97 family phage prohead protease [Paenibacillus sp. strain BS8-2]